MQPAFLRRLLAASLGTVLVADALWLMGQRLFNVGVLLPLVIGACLLGLAVRWNGLHGWLVANGRRMRAWRLLWVGVAAWLVSLAAFWTVLARAQAVPAQGPEPVAILVLGSGTPGGKVSPVLAARLDVALREARRHPRALVVTSGGVGFGESQSEAAVMAAYLRAGGLAASRLVQEGESTSTHENLVLSRRTLDARGIAPQAPVYLVTSDFHTLRAGWIARRAGHLNVTPVGAPTPLYVRYNAWLREYFAVISGFVLREFA